MTNDFDLDAPDMENKTAFKEGIGTRFRQMREYSGLSQKETAKIFQMNQSNIARIEKGIVFPNMAICEYFHSHFNIDMNWLITGAGTMICEEEIFAKEPIDYGEFTDEMKDLLFHLDNVPTSRINILKFFMGYKLENKKNIMKFLKDNNITRG